METQNSAYPVPESVSAVNIPDGFGFDPKLFCLKEQDLQYIDKVIVPEGLIEERCKKLAADILKDLKSEGIQELTVVVILNSAYRFWTLLHD